MRGIAVSGSWPAVRGGSSIIDSALLFSRCGGILAPCEVEEFSGSFVYADPIASRAQDAAANKRMNADRGIPRGFAALHTPAGYPHR